MNEETLNEILETIGMKEMVQSKFFMIGICKQYLSETDFVITKISEANILGEDIEMLLKKYEKTIEARKEARKKINELEQ